MVEGNRWFRSEPTTFGKLRGDLRYEEKGVGLAKPMLMRKDGLEMDQTGTW